MSATVVGRRWNNRSGSENDRLEREYSYTVVVRTTSKLDGVQAVKAATGVPRIGDVYIDADGTVDTGARCKHRDVRQSDESPRLWEVECEFGTLSQDQTRQAENPLERPTEIEVDHNEFTKPLTVDLTGKAVVNSAGQPFDPESTQVDTSRALLRLTRNEGAFNFGLLSQYGNAVNSDVWFGFPAGSCKMKPIKGRLGHENNVSFWAVIYVVEVRPEGWRVEPLDAGRCELISNKLRNIKDEIDGSYISDPVPLNGVGRQLKVAATTLIGTGLPIGGSSFRVASLANFPAAPFTVKVGSEKIRVGSMDILNSQMNVAAGGRGYAGTTEAEHAFGAALTLEPYYLNFKGYNELPFAVLNLP